MENLKAVVSLGHEALGVNTQEQREAIQLTGKVLADIIESGYQLVITHSNGPQVSMIHKAMTELHRMFIDYTSAPMCVCSAMSQGYIGYDIQNSVKTELLRRGITKPISTILTQVSVDPYDEAFYAPTKEIGRYMSKEDADSEVKKGNFVKEVPGKGFRRIIAAPQPHKIIELDAIKALIDAGQEVVACGGGGIPVIEQGHVLKGPSAVIEKDVIAGKLATDLNFDRLIMFTSVPSVYKNFGKEDQEPIMKMNIAQAKEYIEAGEFGEGNMLPKIEAAISFLESNHNGSVLITSLAAAQDALKGKAGTFITFE